MASRERAVGGIDCILLRACDLPAAARERLHLAADCTDPVEVYRYRREPSGQQKFTEIDRQQVRILEAALTE